MDEYWTSLDEFGQIWTSLDKFGQVWTSGQHALGCANGKKEAERIRKGIKNLSGDGEEEEGEEGGGESRV